NASTYNKRGLAWSCKKVYDKAIADYDVAARLDPNEAWAFHGRAWIYATCPDERYRDGRKAVELANRACELSGWQDGRYLSTLAAAYAETGYFFDAVVRQQEANELYSDGADKDAGAKRMRLYLDKKPYRDHSGKPDRVAASAPRSIERDDSLARSGSTAA